MGFTPGLRRESIGVTEESSYLASEHLAVLRAGITVDSTLIEPDVDGNIIIERGTVMGKITATGKWTPYDSAGIDGEEDAVGFLNETINLKNGDVMASLLTHGAVIVARCTGLDATARTAMAGRYFWYE